MLLASVFRFHASAQDQPLKTLNTAKEKGGHKTVQRCSTMEILEEAIQKDPTLPEKWRLEGERQYKLYLQRQPQINDRGILCAFCSHVNLWLTLQVQLVLTLTLQSPFFRKRGIFSDCLLQNFHR